MPHCRCLPALALPILAFALASPALGQDYDLLQVENDQLRARIRALEASFDGDHGPADDEHGGDDHDEGLPFDCFEHGHVGRHETVDGYPFMHLLRTEHAWLERKVQLGYASVNNADGGELDESELEVEFFWALSSRLAVLVELPFLFLDPVDDANTEGVGDLEVGLQLIAFNGEYTILACGLNIATPTGDSARGLGAGHTSLEPKFYVWHDLGCGTAFQGEFFLELPVDTDEVENEFVYNMGLSKTLAATADWRTFRYLSPLIELNAVTVLNGPESGETVVNLTPGVRWIVAEEDQFGIGLSFPISGTEEFDSELILSYIKHF